MDYPLTRSALAYYYEAQGWQEIECAAFDVCDAFWHESAGRYDREVCWRMKIEEIERAIGDLDGESMDYPNTRAALQAYYDCITGASPSWNKSANDLDYDVRLAFYEDTWRTRTKDQCLSMTVSEIRTILESKPAK